MSRPDTSSLKRLKVRKGTFSCWECKQRKKRCEFKPPSSECTSCQRRGLSCLSQEFEVESDTRPEHGQVEKNIDRVEALVGQLLRQSGRRGQRTDPRAGVPNGSMQLTVPSSLSGFSVGSYLHSILPPPAAAAVIIERGKFALLPSRQVQAVGAVQPVQALVQLSPSAHPVQFARRLIQLALCLQQPDELVCVDAARYVEIASNLVTSKDDLVDSLDGLEALIMEATYHIHGGHMRVAWLRFRRALAIAQLMGLGQPGMTGRAEGIWFLLLLGDRHMSLALGLPFAVEDNYFPEPRGDALSQLNHIQAISSGRIIARNLRMQRHHEPEYDETRNIDSSLKQVARSLPAGWWAFSALDGLAEAELLEKTSALCSQLTHHYLVVVLHQPYLAQSLIFPTTNKDVSYSKLVIPSAGREVLLRFLTIRSFHRGASYRGFDEKARTAMLALLLAHIDGHRDGQANALEHQRPQDLVVINDVLTLFEELSGPSSGTESMKKLVRIEAEVADGANYLWTEETGIGLELTIPYFGTLCCVSARSLGQVSHQDSALLSSAGSLDLLDVSEEPFLFGQGLDTDLVGICDMIAETD